MLFELRACRDIYDLADLLDIPAKVLTYILYVVPNAQKYTEHCLSKKNGGTRKIHAPMPRLKDLQSRLAEVLYDCQDELDKAHGPRRSFGFEKSFSIIDNANCHKRKRWVFNVDLEEFFPSINFGRVITFFKKNKNFALESKIAAYVAQIACYENHLPQGAPSSPVISNLICGSLDYRLAKLAVKHRCDYSRYADDITFSTNLREFPSLIAKSDVNPQGWKTGGELTAIIKRSGFHINHNKTRMSHRRSRQVVTGLVVNRHPNFRREYYKNVRSAIDHLIKGEPVTVPRFCKPFRLNCEDEDISTAPINVLQGQIAFCANLADINDLRTPKEKFFKQNSVTRSYGDLLFYRYFANGGKPLVITEGESDIFYLKSALLQAKESIPNLVEYKQGERNELLIDFFKFPKHAERTMGLAAGSGNLYLFLERYKNFLKRCNKSILNRKMIMLLDNDDGLKELTKRFKKLFQKDVTLASLDPYTIFSDLAAVVRTPHSPVGLKSAIEDFLDPAALSVTLDGKVFSPNSNFDTSKHFGKVALATHIYDHRKNYDFKDMNPILDRLSQAIGAL